MTLGFASELGVICARLDRVIRRARPEMEERGLRCPYVPRPANGLCVRATLDQAGSSERFEKRSDIFHGSERRLFLNKGGSVVPCIKQVEECNGFSSDACPLRCDAVETRRAGRGPIKNQRRRAAIPLTC